MRILLIVPYFMDLYKDVKSELENQGNHVVSLEDKGVKNDPYLTRYNPINKENAKRRDRECCQYWTTIITALENKNFDVLLMINGTSFSKVIIQILEQYNPHIRKILYLWDRTYKNYNFDRIFYLFDKVMTYDRIDSQIFKIEFLPNYWIEASCHKKTYDVSAFGTYRDDRYKIYKKVYDAVQAVGLKEYIRLYHTRIQFDLFNKLKRKLALLFLKRKYISEDVYNSKIIVNTPLSPSEFRNLVYSSKCIIDTYNTFQEGMTPRFMWALGAGVKIITTNSNAEKYPFFSREQIYILKEGDKVPVNFITTPYYMPANIRKEVDKYRIDNWIKTILK